MKTRETKAQARSRIISAMVAELKKAGIKHTVDIHNFGKGEVSYVVKTRIKGAR